ncbi:G-protein alpha subunit-domain-containing protein [Russula compacta]|nr:G-protein alpha subunit-domain-containing protein [Russula compacta]
MRLTVPFARSWRVHRGRMNYTIQYKLAMTRPLFFENVHGVPHLAARVFCHGSYLPPLRVCPQAREWAVASIYGAVALKICLRIVSIPPSRVFVGATMVRRSASGQPAEESDDPLLRAMAPPADETPEQRAARLAEEDEARLVSERIDEDIRKEKQQQRRPPAKKVILLGQEGSGFRAAYAPRAWREERQVWRTVIRLDLVRSVNKIVDALDDDDASNISDAIWSFRMRPSSLRHVQRDLEEHLGLTEGEEMRATAITEFVVKQGQQHRQHNRSDQRSLVEQAIELVIAFRDDIAALWRDDGVRAAMDTHGTRLDGHSCFFLDNIDRIMGRDYEPSDDDVMHMRSRTMLSVQEHHLMMESGRDVGNEWILYDVSCSRTQRASWVPYLMDVDAIVFHVPIYAFDRRLEEDPSVNRLQDSVNVWTMICASQLIKKVSLILVLSGCDALRDKLERGVSINRFITSYGDRANDLSTATDYFRKQFLGISRRNSSERRTVYVHTTASIDPDTHCVAAVVSNVLDHIFRRGLEKSALH